MTVTVDVATEAVRTDTSSPFTWGHAGAASGVKGVIVAAVHGVSATDHISAVSYGGVALTRAQRNTDTVTEQGAAEIWFLGSGVPQGNRTVSVTCGATTDDFHFTSITLLGDRDTRVIDADGISENVANPSVTLQYAGYSAMAFAALYGGGAAPTSFTPNANCTTVHDHDLGAFYSEIIRQTTAGSADFAIGGTSATDDVAFAAIAVTDDEATGTAAVTEADDTSSASGTVTVTGTMAVTEAADTSAASGLVTVTGTGAVTEADDTSDASGTVGAGDITGTSAVVEADDSVSAAGEVAVLGTSAVTEANDTSAASGLVTVTGTLAVTEADDLSAAAGEVSGGPITGTSAVVEADDIASASGEVSGGELPAVVVGGYRKRKLRAARAAAPVPAPIIPPPPDADDELLALLLALRRKLEKEKAAAPPEPEPDWRDRLQEEHDRAFAIAAKMDEETAIALLLAA